jgi:hypothetical protein
MLSHCKIVKQLFLLLFKQLLFIIIYNIFKWIGLIKLSKEFIQKYSNRINHDKLMKNIKFKKFNI